MTLIELLIIVRNLGLDFKGWYCSKINQSTGPLKVNSEKVLWNFGVN